MKYSFIAALQSGEYELVNGRLRPRSQQEVQIPLYAECGPPMYEPGHEPAPVYEPRYNGGRFDF